MQWHRQFWEEPQTKAEFEYWTKMPTWSLEEIVALSLGKSPYFVSSEKFVHGTRGTDFSTAYFSRLEIVQRHHADGELSERTRPTRVIEWALEYDFPMPEELVERVQQMEKRRMEKRVPPEREPAVSAREQPFQEATDVKKNETQPDQQITQAEDASPERQLAIKKAANETGESLPGKRQLDNLRALLAVMAISKFQYDPNAEKSPVPQKLARLLERHGVTVGPQTIRKPPQGRDRGPAQRSPGKVIAN